MVAVEVFVSPQWSPDGSSIAAVRFPADVAASPRRTSVSSPRWSPDGARLAYLSHPAQDDAHRALAFDRVAVVSAGGGTPRFLAPDVAHRARRIAWSGDGARIFFEAFTGETGELFSAPLSGGDATPLTAIADGLEYAATYSRDCSTTACLLEDPRHPPEVHVSPTAAFAPKALTSFNAGCASAWILEHVR